MTEEIWNKIQERKAKHAVTRGKFRARNLYILSGRIKCGCEECRNADGSMKAMVGNARKPKDKPKYVSYRCGNRTRDEQGVKICSNREIRREYIESFVIDSLSERLFSDKSIKYITRQINARAT